MIQQTNHDAVMLCEFCDSDIGQDGPMPGYDRCFCSDDCAADWEEDRRVALATDLREQEIWGNDYDSWYR